MSAPEVLSHAEYVSPGAVNDFSLSFALPAGADLLVAIVHVNNETRFPVAVCWQDGSNPGGDPPGAPLTCRVKNDGGNGSYNGAGIWTLFKPTSGTHTLYCKNGGAASACLSAVSLRFAGNSFEGAGLKINDISITNPAGDVPSHAGDLVITAASCTDYNHDANIPDGGQTALYQAHGASYWSAAWRLAPAGASTPIGYTFRETASWNEYGGLVGLAIHPRGAGFQAFIVG